MHRICYAVLLAITMLHGVGADSGRASTNEFSQVRIDRICQQIRRVYDLREAADLLGQVAMLTDDDPWVRSFVQRRLLRETTFEDAWRSVVLPPLDPWAPKHLLVTNVTVFLSTTHMPVELKYNEQYQLPRYRGQPSLYPVERFALEELLYLVQRELSDGRREAADVLVALLESREPQIQAKALVSLIANTDCGIDKSVVLHYMTKDRTPSHILEWKDEWLSWWTTNKGSFVPKKRQRTMPF